MRHEIAQSVGVRSLDPAGNDAARQRIEGRRDPPHRIFAASDQCTGDAKRGIMMHQFRTVLNGITISSNSGQKAPQVAHSPSKIHQLHAPHA